MRSSPRFVRGGGFAANTLEWADQIRNGDPVRMPFPPAARSLVDEQSVEDARRQYAVTMGEGYANEAVSDWETLVDRPEPPRDDVQKILGRPAHTFADWAAYHVEDFRTLSVAEVAKRYADGVASRITREEVFYFTRAPG